MRLRAALPSLIAAATVALPAAAAPAATVSVIDRGRYDGPVMTFDAATGEVNQVTVEGSMSERRVVDTGAPVTAGRGCRQVGEHEAVCSGVFDTTMTLRDGDDRVVLERAARVDGGVGDDTLTGSPGGDSLGGGDGRDTIDGRGGPDFVRDDDEGVFADTLAGGAGDDHLLYDGPQGVRVNLGDPSAPAGAEGEGDMQSGFESVIANTAGPSELIGTEGSNSLTARGAGSRIVAGGGIDLITAGDDAEIDGGAGADRLGAGPGSRTLCGAGTDELSAFATGHLAPDCERLPLQFVDIADAVIRPHPKVRGRVVGFRVPCPSEAGRRGCRGRVLLRDPDGLPLGKRAWTTRRGRTPTIGVTLAERDAERIRGEGGLVTRVSIIVSAGGYDRARAGYSVTLTAP